MRRSAAQALARHPISEVLDRIEALNHGDDPQAALARLEALATLSSLDTESLLHFAAFVAKSGLNASRG